MPIPYWVLALTYWLHLAAVVTWIGSLVSISVLILPASQRTLSPVDQLAFIESIQKRLEPIAWFSISVLVVTGLLQMSVNRNYNGFLSTSGEWSLAILAKHVLVATLIAVSAAHTWDVLPAIRRALMRKDKIDVEKLAALQRREMFLLRTSLVLAALILLATAFARAASS
jgi:uncharacterized membrane protein